MATPTTRNARAVRTARRLRAALEPAGVRVHAVSGTLVIEAPGAVLTRRSQSEIYEDDDDFWGAMPLPPEFRP